MKALIIGIDGFIGAELFTRLSSKRGMQVFGTSRRGNGIDLDLLNPEKANLPKVDIAYLCASMTRFIDCEADSRSYAVNVDAQITIAKMVQPSKVVYLSSEAVERALHTNYGMQKALAEIGLRAVCDPVIVRLSKVVPDMVDHACEYLSRMTSAKPGIYRWPQDMVKEIRIAA